MITLEHIRTLGGVELKVLSYLYMKDTTLDTTQKELSQILSVSDRSLRVALKNLEDRGLINYKRASIFHNEKPSIQVH